MIKHETGFYYWHDEKAGCRIKLSEMSDEHIKRCIKRLMNSIYGTHLKNIDAYGSFDLRITELTRQIKILNEELERRKFKISSVARILINSIYGTPGKRCCLKDETTEHIQKGYYKFNQFGKKCYLKDETTEHIQRCIKIYNDELERRGLSNVKKEGPDGEIKAGFSNDGRLVLRRVHYSDEPMNIYWLTKKETEAVIKLFKMLKEYNML